jgi:hypothetical protein
VVYVSHIVDAPWFGTPISWEVSGPFSVDREGNLKKFEVEDVDPADAEMVKEHGPGGFNYFAHDFFSVPRTSTLYVLTSDWYQIGADRRGFRIRGFPPNTEVVSHFDPGSGPILFGTTKGAYAVSSDGTAQVISGLTGAVRVFAQDPSDQYVLAGSTDGLFRIRTGTLAVERIPNGSADVIGTIGRILHVDFANIDIVYTERGAFAFEGDEIRAVPSLAPWVTRVFPSAGPLPIFVLPHLQRVLVSKSDRTGPIISELRRSANDGTCPVPLKQPDK